MFLTETELAYAENLILIGGVPAPKVIYLVRYKELSADERMLWQISAEMGIADKQVLNDAYTAASEAMQGASEQAFSFGEGAMIGPWELGQRKASWIGGEVWTARQGLGRQAFLRLIPPGSGTDGERKARFVERSNPGLEPPHPTILKVDEADEDFGWLYTATENLDGQSLVEILRQPLPERSGLTFMHGLTQTLQIVHGLGVVHGGLNPLGIVIREARPHLTDFGFSSALLDGPSEGNRPGGRLGALLFAPPALIAGDAQRGLDARDDLYALGCLLYLLVCNPQPTDEPVQGLPWFAEPAISPNTRELLMRLISGQTAAYPSASSLLGDLGAVAQGAGPGPLPPEQSARGRRAPSSTAQIALGWDGPDPDDAEEEGGDEVADADEDPAPKRGASGRLGKSSGRVKAGASGKLGKASSGKLGKASSGKLGKASSGALKTRASSRLQTPAGRPKGQGWGVLFTTVVLIGGAAGMAFLATQPQPIDQARGTLAQAFRAYRQAPVAYDVVVDLTQRAIKEGTGDPALTRRALQLRQAALAAAARERGEILGGGEPPAEGAPDPSPKLLDLRERLTNMDLAALIDYDLLTRKQEDVVPIVWAERGTSLLEAGFPTEATDALTKGSRPEKNRAALASRMAFLPGGPYLVPGEGEALTLVQRQPVYVGRTEVTRGEYRDFLRAIATQKDPHDCCDQTEPDGKDHAPDGWGPAHGPDDPLPATGVDYYDAVAYASRLGGRLPDAETLAAAARGPLALPFPWGSDAPALGLANYGELLGAVTPVGSFPGGAGEGGALDLLGNVAEWVTPAGDALKPTAAPVWGGDCKTKPEALAPEALEELPLATRNERVGFRILVDVKAAQ